MTQPINPTEALYPRARALAALLAGRHPDPGVWADYHRDDPLYAELVMPGMVTYRRTNVREAVLVFRNITSVHTVEVQRSGPTVVESDILERWEYDLDIPAGVDESQTVSHTFSKRQTLSQLVKAGAEAQVKGTFSEGGIGAEISAKIYAEYQRQWGDDQAEDDTVSNTINVKGPMVLRMEAVRSCDRERWDITATGDLDHSVELIDERLPRGPEYGPVYHLADMYRNLLDTMQGRGPRHYADGRANDYYDLFINNPLTSPSFFDMAVNASVQLPIEHLNVNKMRLGPVQ